MKEKKWLGSLKKEKTKPWLRYPNYSYYTRFGWPDNLKGQKYQFNWQHQWSVSQEISTNYFLNLLEKSKPNITLCMFVYQEFWNFQENLLRGVLLLSLWGWCGPLKRFLDRNYLRCEFLASVHFKYTKFCESISLRFCNSSYNISGV